MMPGCAAIGCNNRSEKGYTMKCFPRDPTLRLIWKKRVGRADWEPSNNSFLCHVHFEPSQWIVTPSGRIKLKKGALPTIFTVTSTRKSPKKRQKLGSNCSIDEDEYEVEYLDNEETMFVDMSNGKSESDDVNHQEASETLVQSIKFLDSDALKNLQHENVIIVADEHNREIGKLVSNNGFLAENFGKENVQAIQNKMESMSYMKVEIKEEAPNDTYDEIERKLQEICYSDNDNDNDTNSTTKSINCDLFTVNNGEMQIKNLEKIYKNFKSEMAAELPTTKSTTIKHKNEAINEISKITQKSVTENQDEVCCDKFNSSKGTPKESIFTIKLSGVAEDVSEIIRDLDTETSMEYDQNDTKSESSKSNPDTNAFITSVITVKDISSKNITNNKLVQNVPSASPSHHENNILFSTTETMDSLKTPKELCAKINMQKEVIEKLSSQLIMYKDTDMKLSRLTRELENKKSEVYSLNRKLNSKKLPDKRAAKFATDTKTFSDFVTNELKNKIEQLEDKTKKLMKTITLETQNRRRLEYKVKNRDNRIKEMQWKLDKASKYLERAEKNANTYRKKMLTMQALMRRKRLLEEKQSLFDEVFVGHYNQDFSESALQTSLEIEKACGMDGYKKLLSYNFPLPSLETLSERFPSKFIMVDDRCEAIENLDETKFYNVEYLEISDTITGTVQDIFDESDNDDLSAEELQRHLEIDPNRTL